MLFRLVFLIGCLLALGGAGYLSYYGAFRESTDVSRSIRTGSHGGGFVSTRVK